MHEVSSIPISALKCFHMRNAIFSLFVLQLPSWAQADQPSKFIFEIICENEFNPPYMKGYMIIC